MGLVELGIMMIPTRKHLLSAVRVWAVLVDRINSLAQTGRSAVIISFYDWLKTSSNRYRSVCSINSLYLERYGILYGSEGRSSNADDVAASSWLPFHS